MSPLFPYQVAVAFVLDWLVGDPRWLPHPVIGMGKLIVWVERIVRPLYDAFSCDSRSRQRAGRWLGLLFPLLVGGASFLFAWLLVQTAAKLHWLLADVVEILLISTTIATKGLADAGRAIYRKLVERDLPGARQQLSQVVGRDTKHLDEREVTRGAVETIAENIVDAVTAPLLFALIGGAPLAFLYRAVNTLDSMVGYKNERYRDLGWASARLDDLCNWLPARLTYLTILIAAWVLGHDARGVWKIGRRDASKHPSPNSGWAEAAVAGALRVQLGGTNYYQGVPSHRALLGDPAVVLHPVHILHTIHLLYLSTALYCGIGLLLCWLLSYLLS
ncbi:adenosylcobinamide-phosphate synthase CbiB [Brevibacillus humidisoli]|uniref:adenosylcobinamide-phosphate synthase CbiB n=1 Tax=Brevibacillus humidisoli TaxID=2895522 RepID=UPI001E399C35|nr:adenosylcobinamide-phosphate synthase CbiB [Brevibacillus humidisoli]UFJ42646.1 adenosylcobinamide-phosphate synthase CbiB [Brevibacillus humidisoli]